MDERGLFTVALGLREPWRVIRNEFDSEAAQLDLYLDFERGARFGCPTKDCTHGSCPVHDTVEHSWRHLDFFQYKTLVHARLPRVRCPEHGVRQVGVAWARPGSGFTLLFEALVLRFAVAMPVSKVAVLTAEHDTRIWRIVEHHVHAIREQLDCTGVRRIAVNETSAAKGHDYISIFADLDAQRVIFATEGPIAEAIARFAADLAEHGGDPAKVTDTSSGIGTALINGIREHLPNATMTFDRYHLAATLNEAIDSIHRQEAATRPELTHTRSLWLKEHTALSATQRRELQRLIRSSTELATARAWRWREDFQGFYRQHPSSAPDYLRRWCSDAKRSGLQPIKDFATLIETHWDGVLGWHANHLDTDPLEGINSLIQAAKARARGYRSASKMITIVYLTAAKLPLSLLTGSMPAYPSQL